MNAYADTSFCASLYWRDDHSAASAAWLRKAGWRLTVTELGYLELLNRLELAAFRGQANLLQVRRAAANVEADLTAGVLLRRPMPASAWERAASLARAHSAQLGCRSLDILHVASAVELGATEFLTYDQRQAALARSAGLAVRPGRA